MRDSDRPESSTPDSPELTTASKLLLGFALALVAVTFARALLGDLIWDDPFFVPGFDGQPQERGLLETVKSTFWDNSSYHAQRPTDFWRPLTSAVIWVSAMAFGAWTPGYHLVSLLASFGAAFALFLLLKKISPGRNGPLVPAWVALIMVAHPLNAEVVGMISNVSDHLVLLFLSLQIWLLMGPRADRPRKTRFLLVGLFSLMACASKEIGVLGAIGPLAAWLLDTSTSKDHSRTLKDPLAWIASALPPVLYLIARYMVIDATGRGHDFMGDSAFSLEVMFLGWGLAIQKALAPVASGAHSFIPPGQVIPWLIAAAAWTGLLALSLRAVLRRKLDIALVGSVIAVALLIPSLLAVKISDGALRFPTRYFHMPMAGLMIACLPVVARNWRRGFRIAVPAAVILLCMLSWIRIAEWRDNVSFFAAESAYHPESVAARLNLVQAQCRARAFDEAEETLLTLRELPPSDSSTTVAMIHNAFAKIAFLRDGDFERADAHLKKALEADPRNLDNALLLAELRWRTGHANQALGILRDRLEADWPDAREKALLHSEIRKYEAMGVNIAP